METKTPQGVEPLLSEIVRFLKDAATAFSAGQASAEEISSTLIDLTTALEGNKPSADIAAAIRGLRVQVTVSPTPITVMPAPVQFVERERCAWEVTHDVARNGQIVKSRISPVPLLTKN